MTATGSPANRTTSRASSGWVMSWSMIDIIGFRSGTPSSRSSAV
jgi:hypothetical protein